MISLTDFDGFTARRAIQLLAGNDRFTSSLGGSWVEGGAGNDTLIGLSGQDSFVGGLGEDSMNGGDGGDIYTVDAVDRVVDSGATGRDAIIAMGGTYVLPNSIEDLLAGGGNIVGNGNYKANYMSGGLGKDALSGLAGADTLNGSRGDTLLGGTGDDTYVLNATVVQVVEAAGAGRDAVQTNLSSATLADNVEILRHLGTFAFVGTGNDAANLIQSGDGADTLRGLGGDDTLVGGGGANRLAGGTGDDTYVVTEATDVIVELDGQGRDTVNTGLMTYVLPDFVENLQMTGNFTGLGSSATGNALDNTITGGASAENLNGLDGNDFLSGMAGFDTLIGGLGNDTYRIDDDGNEQDLVIEAALGGTDTILLKRYYYFMTDAANVENLRSIYTGATRVGGNDLDNRISTRDGADTLTGKRGMTV